MEEVDKVCVFSGTTQVCQYQKGKTNLEQETVSGSIISWAICKSAPCSRVITMPVPQSHHSFFYRQMPFLPPNQQCQSTEGINGETESKKVIIYHLHSA